MMQSGGMGMAGSVAVLALFWVAIAGVSLAAWIFVLVTMWRAMKAHESIAQSLRKMADRQA